MIASVSKTPRMLRLTPEDNVLVAIDTVDKGATAPERIGALERIGKGHKMAAADIKPGQPVRKFGQIIGFASQDIARGGWVHEHNTGLHTSQKTSQLAHPALVALGRNLPVEHGRRNP